MLKGTIRDEGARAMSTGVALVVAGLALVLGGCGAFFDLDVTVFAELDLDDSLVGLETDRPASTVPYLLTQTTEVDLTEHMDSKAGDISRVILSDLAYRVPENDVTADLVDVRLFIAPAGTTTLSDSRVIEIGSIARVQARELIETTALPIDAVTLGQIEVLMDGLQFTLIVSGYVGIDPTPAELPTGSCRIEVDVRGEAHLR